MPRDLVADEQLTRVAKQQVSVPTTVGGGCFLGVSVVEAADTVTVERGDGACAKEAKALAPDYQARSVCTDGWEATRQAWRGLFPKITLVRCFLHAILKMKKHGAGQLRHQVLDKAWQVYQAATTRQFAQRLRRVAEWTPLHLSGPVAQMVLQRCRRRADFTPAYDVSAGPPHLQCGRSAARLTKTGCSTPCAIGTAPPLGHLVQLLDRQVQLSDAILLALRGRGNLTCGSRHVMHLRDDFLKVL